MRNHAEAGGRWSAPRPLRGPAERGAGEILGSTGLQETTWCFFSRFREPGRMNKANRRNPAKQVYLCATPSPSSRFVAQVGPFSQSMYCAPKGQSFPNSPSSLKKLHFSLGSVYSDPVLSGNLGGRPRLEPLGSCSGTHVSVRIGFWMRANMVKTT